MERIVAPTIVLVLALVNLVLVLSTRKKEVLKEEPPVVNKRYDYDDIRKLEEKIRILESKVFSLEGFRVNTKERYLLLVKALGDRKSMGTMQKFLCPVCQTEMYESKIEGKEVLKCSNCQYYNNVGEKE